MNAKHRLVQRRRAEQRRTGTPEQDLLDYLRAAAAISRPRPEPDPAARRASRPASRQSEQGGTS